MESDKRAVHDTRHEASLISGNVPRLFRVAHRPPGRTPGNTHITQCRGHVRKPVTKEALANA
jgi:hypothetical protein